MDHCQNLLLQLYTASLRKRVGQTKLLEELLVVCIELLDGRDNSIFLFLEVYKNLALDNFREDIFLKRTTLLYKD